MIPGKKIYDQIKDAIQLFDRLLIVLSEESMKSEWVASEVRAARNRERAENRRILFPVSIVPFANIRQWECFDSDTGKDLAVEIREYFVPDFSQWEDDKHFDTQLQHLLRGLAESEHIQRDQARAPNADI